MEQKVFVVYHRALVSAPLFPQSFLDPSDAYFSDVSPLVIPGTLTFGKRLKGTL